MNRHVPWIDLNVRQLRSGLQSSSRNCYPAYTAASNEVLFEFMALPHLVGPVILYFLIKKYRAKVFDPTPEQEAALKAFNDMLFGRKKGR
jgi:hypothetical protein